jgi:hypothetical protein
MDDRGREALFYLSFLAKGAEIAEDNANEVTKTGSLKCA